MEDGRHGDMGYLAREDAIARRADLRRTLPSVRSVVVVGHEYFQEDPPGVPADPARGVIARYARGQDYHGAIKKRLLELHRWIEASVEGPIEGRVYVDTGPILEREIAVRAGVGWFGKNTMLIHPKRGSYFFLGCCSWTWISTRTLRSKRTTAGRAGVVWMRAPPGRCWDVMRRGRR